MTMNRNSRAPGVPTPPKGDPIAAYDTYIEAQRAVDHLSDKEFPVQHVTIVGTDLRMVERVTGRLTYSRVAIAGLASGAWFGLFVGLLLSLFTSAGQVLPILPAVAIGAAFGILFSVISYAFTRGRRDFTSSSQIVAGTYALLCATEHAHKARAILNEPGGPGVGRPQVSPTTAPPAAPLQPPTSVQPPSSPNPPSSPAPPPSGPPS